MGGVAGIPTAGIIRAQAMVFPSRHASLSFIHSLQELVDENP